MSESLWESEAAEEAQREKPVAEPVAESSDMTLSVDEFSALEERILRTVNLVKQERQARAAAEEHAAKAELLLREQAPLTERLQKEVSALRGERDHVRQRVERLLAQLDSLEV
ncbi:MAG: hypothetical protein ABSF70_02620 [Terracidiphilus sp.]|jgi:hypothetical protein